MKDDMSTEQVPPNDLNTVLCTVATAPIYLSKAGLRSLPALAD